MHWLDYVAAFWPVLLLLVSEILPFVKSTKANSILQMMFVIAQKIGALLPAKKPDSGAPPNA